MLSILLEDNSCFNSLLHFTLFGLNLFKLQLLLDLLKITRLLNKLISYLALFLSNNFGHFCISDLTLSLHLCFCFSDSFLLCLYLELAYVEEFCFIQLSFILLLLTRQVPLS